MSRENQERQEQSSGNESGHANNGNQGHNNQVTIQIRYQSETVSVTINENASVTALLEQAIIVTENNSVPKDRFQLKLGSTVLDPKRKVRDYPIANGSLLVLSLIAGGGGNY